MIQELFRIGDFAISPFGVMLVVALLAAYAQLTAEMRRMKIGSDDDASAIVVGCGLGGIVGGKIYYALLYRDWGALFDRAGIVWYGCFVAGALVLLWTIRRRKLPMARVFDATGPALALGYAVGRIGCFLVGDDYGKPTDLPWGVVFKNGIPPTTAGYLEDKFGVVPPPGTAAGDWVAVHPTQLYETGAALAIWGVLLWFARRGPRPGNTFLLAVALLSIERFAVELLRLKDDRIFGPLTLAQAISVLLVLVAAGVAAYRGRSAPETAPATGTSS